MTSPPQATLWNRTFAQLQRLGQALMLPVSVLPAAGLMVALGRMLTDFTKDENAVSYQIGKVLFTSGLSVFEQLALIFSVGVAIGFTGAAGTAGLAAVTGYFSFTTVLKTFKPILHLESDINTGVLGGITVGIVVAWLYNRYSNTKLHPVLGFFSGKRLVPILAVFACVFLALVFVVIWPPIQMGIHTFGVNVMGSQFGPSIYASIKRLLIPVGLHHVFYPPFLYEFGEFTTAAGTVVKGETTRYFAGDPSAGRFMASEFPMMLFGLPAAALAMTLRAKPENRKAVAGIMLSAALTSIITGITEPIEFAFTFVAPLLYILHACLAFVSGMLTSAFDIHLGYTFSSSLIDLALGFFNQKNVSMLFLVVGPIIALLYFSVFYFAIGFFNFKTPGREDADLLTRTDSAANAATPEGLRAKAAGVLVAIGGAQNIQTMEACITRLRLALKDPSVLDEKRLKSLGASGVMKAGGNVQIVFGVESDFLKTEIQNLITSGVDPATLASTSASSAPLTAAPRTASTASTSNGDISAPLTGEVLDASQIPDETFAQELMGKTIGIRPTGNTVTAPFDGEVATLFHTHHALGLVSNEGVELLIHIGIDTVKMNGEGFKPFVKQGDRVTKGQKLIEFDRALIEQKAKSIITPVVVTNADQFPHLQLVAKQNINSGDHLWKFN